MRRNKLSVFTHFVWATWDRQPLIAPEIEKQLHRCIEALCKENGCDVLAVGGMEDHVHVLVTLPATISMAELLRVVKSNSSKYANEELLPRDSFRWQANYGAFSVSASHRARVMKYVLGQKEHHSHGVVWEEAETTFIEDEPEPA